MSESVPGTSAEFRFVLADSIAFLNPDHWDCVTARSGLFLSRPFLRLLEQHLPVTYPRTMPSFMQVTGPLLQLLRRALRFGLQTCPRGAFPK